MSLAKLAVNYSPALARLIQEGVVAIDLFKLPDWHDLIAEAQALGPLYVHFPVELGATKLGVDVDAATTLMERTRTPHFNAHVVPSKERFPNLESGDVSPEARAAVADALVTDVGVLAETVGAERVIIENVPYRGPEHGLLRAGVEAETIRRVVEETGCGLLLDLAHAFMTATTLGVGVWEYVDALPTHALRELHVSGVRELEGRQRDSLPLTAEDIELIRGALGRVRAGAWPAPEVVAFEYGGVGPVFDWRTEPEVLSAQVPLLRELLTD